MSAITKGERITRRTRVACIAALCLGAAGALAGCGGSSAPKGPTAQTETVTTVHRARPTLAQSSPDIGKARAQRHHRQQAGGSSAAGGSQNAQAPVKVTPIKVEKSRPTPARSNDDESTTGATPLNPCKLVSLSEAQTITSGAVTGRVEAPLGPTCIYKRKGSGPGITLAVEVESFSQATHQLRRRSQVTVAGRHAYCGRLGTEMLLVPVGRNQLLNVTAPCSIAHRFAALAMSHLPA